MKFSHIFYLLILLIVSGCDGKVVKHPEIGAWQLHYFKRISADTLTFEVIGYVTGTNMKVWSGKNFISVGNLKEDSVYRDNYAAGTYKLNGIFYEEHIQYHVNKSYIDKTIKMVLQIKGDTLIQIWPVRDDGTIDKRNYSVEKYVRIK